MAEDLKTQLFRIGYVLPGLQPCRHLNGARSEDLVTHSLCGRAVKFGTYATKDVRITGKEPQKLGSAEIPSLVVGVWPVFENTYFMGFFQI